MGGRKSIRARRMVPLLVLFLMGVTTGPMDAREKVTVGLVEDVVLMPWKIKLPARIDTGAAISSLDARGLKVIGEEVEFHLPPKYGGQKLRLPVAGWHTVRSSEAKERRPVVEIDICVGPKLLKARVNLNDRTQMKYPFLMGRNILTPHFLVDCDRNHCAPPKCFEETEK